MFTHAPAACAAARSPALCNIDITRNKLAFYGELFSFFSCRCDALCDLYCRHTTGGCRAAIRIKTVRLVFASARIYTAETVGKWPLSERQFCKKPQVVGASIARPRTRAIRIKSGVCRNFSAFRRADGQWPPLRVQDFKPLCHSENGDV